MLAHDDNSCRSIDDNRISSQRPACDSHRDSFSKANNKIHLKIVIWIIENSLLETF